MAGIFFGILIEKKIVAANTILMKFVPSIPIFPKPGQFFLLSVKESRHFLKRPISIHYFYDETGYFKLLIRIKGDGTKEITSIKFHDELQFIGPLGNGFPMERNKKIAVIAGGIGIAPFPFLIKRLRKYNCSVDLYYGEASRKDLVEYWRITGINSFITTEDGSEERKGNILSYFDCNEKKYDLIYACGPEGMYKAFKKRYSELSDITYISLERKMACGVGSCKGCQIKTKNGYKYVCSDGPVFRMDDL